MYHKCFIRFVAILILLNSFVRADGILDFDENKPVLYYADTQTYDRDLGILILRGNVQFNHQGAVLEADYVTYNEKLDLVTASGNVRLRETNNNIYFGEYLELTGDLKEGVILGIRTLLEDDSKIAALEGRKYQTREEFDQMVYTPCELCGDAPPTWQLNAKKAVKDNEGKTLALTDTQLRILDVPLLYLPYAVQPYTRTSGFLIPQPRYTTDQEIGFVAEVPFFWAISEDKDLTIAPAFLTGQGTPFLSGEYRQAFTTGMFKTEGSITKYEATGKNKAYEIPNTRGHVFGKTAFDLSDKWRTRAEGGYVSDKTYFRKYVFSRWQGLPNLTSKGIVEGFLDPRDYAAGSVSYYQGLRETDVQDAIPMPLPFFEYKGFSGVDFLGGRFDYDANFLNITRTEDTRMQRGIGQIGWQRPWVIPTGQVFKPFGSIRGDLYGVNTAPIRHAALLNSTSNSQNFPFNHEKTGGARFFPQTGLRWDWPWVASPCPTQDVIIQPIAQVIGAPKQPMGVASKRIPDIDSLDFVFNDVNIYAPDRYPGYDLIDTGSRITYGGELITTGELLGDIELFLGQNYAMSGEYTELDSLQGLRQGSSDYLSRLEATPWKWMKFIYRARWADQTFKPLVTEVQGTLGPAIANVSGTYVYLNKNTRLLENRNFNQLSIVASSQFTKNLLMRGILTRNLQKKKDGGGSLLRGIGLTYLDDCFTMGFTVQRQYFVAKDLQPETLYLFTIGFKSMGDFHVLSYDIDGGLFGRKRSRQIE